MKTLSRLLGLGVFCFAVACGGPVEAPASELESTEQHSRPCSFESQCPSGQTCVLGTCVPVCDPAAPSVVCGDKQCCPGYTAPNGNQSKPYCSVACFG
ncbi:hypothetical protein [Myxococcus stipitatus]|uniref:hypothetical protein n=1 Tax=Myxococcus stipitatus TaxID=83455 RepID=UPI0030CE9B5D